MKVIKHQTQPTALSCIATCLAMLCGRPAKFVDQEFTPKYVRNQHDIPMFLAMWGIICKPQITAGIHQLSVGSLYLATVPSLMSAGLLHQIIIDVRHGKVEVYDPGEGVSKTTQFYVPPDSPLLDMNGDHYNNLAFPLRTWILDYELVIIEDGEQS